LAVDEHIQDSERPKIPFTQTVITINLGLYRALLDAVEMTNNMH
jgi:hypothetical protein